MSDVAIGQTVYVVDDDSGTRVALCSVLRSVGYEVEMFSTGRELIERAVQGISGCIVLDVRLPGPSGLEVQRRLIELGVNIPVIFLTGHGDIAMAVQAMEANAIEFLTKPFRDQDLLDAIALAMQQNIELQKGLVRRGEAQQLLKSLSKREMQIFTLMCQGKLGKQIAHEIEVSEATVKVHRRTIMQKLRVANISQMLINFSDLIKTDTPEPPY